jgi:hypothetical protein
MVIRTYFDKNNTLIYNSDINTAKNEITELFYGGYDTRNAYSRFIFSFDYNRLKSLYNGGTFTDLSKLKHTLRMTNTGAFDKDLLNTTQGSKQRTSSFDLVLFKIDEPWDEGTGYEYEEPILVFGDYNYSTNPSNWIYARTGIKWTNGNGVYSGSPTSIVIGTQHFDNGNENIEIDITSYINGILTGNTSHGLGIAYSRELEETIVFDHQYVGFFTKYTNTFYEPFIETVYSNHIKDDRHNFFLDKDNQLYLYVNVGGQPTNLDELPTVDIIDNNENVFESYNQNQIIHITKGVYAININIPTTSDIFEDVQFYDKWKNLKINGINRPDIELTFVMKDSDRYYNLNDSDNTPKPFAISVSGIKRDEKIKRGDVRKVLVSARIPYTIEQKQLLDTIKYRLYVKEGRNEYTVIDYHQVEIANNINYFLLDTESLIPNIYYLDIQVVSNLEVSTIKETVSFEIVSQVELR